MLVLVLFKIPKIWDIYQTSKSPLRPIDRFSTAVPVAQIKWLPLLLSRHGLHHQGDCLGLTLIVGAGWLEAKKPVKQMDKHDTYPYTGWWF